jgi:hypothetical protein
MNTSTHEYRFIEKHTRTQSCSVDESVGGFQYTAALRFCSVFSVFTTRDVRLGSLKPAVFAKSVRRDLAAVKVGSCLIVRRDGLERPSGPYSRSSGPYRGSATTEVHGELSCIHRLTEVFLSGVVGRRLELGRLDLC